MDELNECESEKLSILRVYQGNRRINTIPESVRKYVPTSIKEGITQVRLPTHEEVKNANIVITTAESCMELVNLKMRGTFTHIFIDEAGQTLEPRLLMPLSLATKDTCIALAGDVMQMSPKVYSTEAQDLSVSLLQRIYDRYQLEQETLRRQQAFQNPREDQNEDSRLDSSHTVVLVENYRNHEMILHFLSNVIYINQEPLMCRSNIRYPRAPLQMHVVQGEEEPGIGTSYYNRAEVQEVGHLLLQYTQNWPQEWGQLNLSKIAVTSVYSDQVRKNKN